MRIEQVTVLGLELRTKVLLDQLNWIRILPAVEEHLAVWKKPDEIPTVIVAVVNRVLTGVDRRHDLGRQRVPLQTRQGSAPGERDHGRGHGACPGEQTGVDA